MPIERVADEKMLEAVLGSAMAVLFKHSTVCGLSASAMRQVRQFSAEHPDVPVFVVDVRAQRPLSQTVAKRLGIEHESPQAIVIRDARVVWHASHQNVTADDMARAIHGG
jgi:bacillithiol system protein YtxJ